jgi:hypothetical protein
MVIAHLRNWYGRFERPLSSLSLILGFVFDALTLKRVDTLWENVWIFAHLIIVGIFIALIHTHKYDENDEADSNKAHFWYVNILQFFLGGIFSTYLVFYFRSADILVTWPFILILAIAFIANEALKRHYERLGFQIALFFLSIYAFAIFLVPVVMHQIGDFVFLLSGLASLLVIIFYILFLYVVGREKFYDSKKIIFYLVTGIFVVINALYLTNLIPPIPLSLKEAGVYHSLARNVDGNYVVTYESQGFSSYFNLYPTYNEVPGTPIYAYSAIFSPSELNTTIIHDWQYYDETQKLWVSMSRVSLSVVGGRDGGFRTFSSQSDIIPGRWRVNVETMGGKLIGHLRFTVTAVDKEPMLLTDIK